MSDTIESLRKQLAALEENLRLIRERKSDYVLETDVPLQIIKDERRLESEIAELQEQLAQAAETPDRRRPARGMAGVALPSKKRPLEKLRPWRPIIAVAAGAVLVVCVAVWLIRLAMPSWLPTLPPSPTDEPTKAPTAEPTKAPADTPMPTPTDTPTQTPTNTPTPMYWSGLITYLGQDESGTHLQAMGRDGTPITLIEGVVDVMVLAVSPDRGYLAVALSGEAGLARSSLYPRFVEGSRVSLVVVPATGGEPTTVVRDVARVDAAYTSEGQLVVAAFVDSTIMYIVAQTDGSDPRVLYRSPNVFATPEVREEVP